MRTVCCSDECERRFECANHAVNNEGTNACEDYYRFGSASLSSYGFDETWWCGELGDWAMFAPIEKKLTSNNGVYLTREEYNNLLEYKYMYENLCK